MSWPRARTHTHTHTHKTHHTLPPHILFTHPTHTQDAWPCCMAVSWAQHTLIACSSSNNNNNNNTNTQTYNCYSQQTEVWAIESIGDKQNNESNEINFLLFETNSYNTLLLPLDQRLFVKPGTSTEISAWVNAIPPPGEFYNLKQLDRKNRTTPDLILETLVSREQFHNRQEREGASNPNE